jgi:hypothetical protein
MIIDLFVNHSEKNHLAKTLTNNLSLSGTLKQETSVINPTVIIETSNPTTYNYMYIPLFHRYYYITDIESIRNNLWRISGKVDVLMSFKDDIRNCNVLISDAQNTPENYVSGEQWKSTVKSRTDIINFSNGFNNTGEYILITSGGIAGGVN